MKHDAGCSVLDTGCSMLDAGDLVMKYILRIDSMCNPVGVRYLFPIPTQRALCDTGLWSGTALQFNAGQNGGFK